MVLSLSCFLVLKRLTSPRMAVDHIKRPMNAFMAWSKEERKKMVDEGTSLNNSALSRLLGERWKLLSDTEKKLWKKTADNLKKEHAKVCVRFL